MWRPVLNLFRSIQRFSGGTAISGRSEARLDTRQGIGIPLIIMTLVTLGISVGYAQDEEANAPAEVSEIRVEALSIEAVEAEIARVEQLETLAPAIRSECLELYRGAIEQLNLAQEWRAKIDEYEQAIQEAPSRLAAAQQELESITATPPVFLPPETTLDDLGQFLATVRVNLASARSSQETLSGELQRRSERRETNPQAIAAVQERLRTLEEDLGAVSEEAYSELAAARRVYLEAQILAARAERDALEIEMLAYDAEHAFLLARIDTQSRRVAQSERLVQDIEARVITRREQNAAEAEAEARDLELAAETYPPLRELAEMNAALTQERTGPEGALARTGAARARLSQVDAELAKVEQEWNSLQQRDSVVGKTPAYGAWLRRYQTSLPDTHAFLRRARIRRTELAEVQFRLIDIQEELDRIEEVRSDLDRMLANLPASLEQSRRDRITALAHNLMEDYQENLEAIANDYRTYSTLLGELDVKVQTLLARTREINSYINERILWIRSADVIAWRDVAESASVLRWLFGPKAWSEIGQSLWADIVGHPVLTGLLGVAMAGLIVVGWRIGSGLGAMTDIPGGSELGGPGIHAIVVILTLIVPGLAWLMGWRLTVAEGGSDISRAFGAGLTRMGWTVFALMLLLCFFMPSGIGRKYFDWRPKITRAVRRWIVRLLVILPGLAFLIAATHSQDQELWQNSLGRIALVIALLSMGFCAFRLLRPAERVATRMHDSGRHARLWRFRHMGYVLAVGTPVSLAVLAVVGYYHTAFHLTSRFTESLWLAGGLLLLNAIVARWLDIAYRRLTLQRYQKRKKAHQATPVPAAPPVPEDNTLGVSKEELDRANQRARQMLRSVLLIVFIACAWGIWSSSLPALKALDRVELWQYTSTVNAPVSSSTEETTWEAVEEVRAVSLADLGLMVLVVVLTVIAATDVPAFLQMGVVQRFHDDVGIRYAIVTVVRYVVIVVGTIFAFGLLGIGWSTVQWLVAAMTVGLGFGLQEIFANFVSGLIILFERPIRIGDTVTIGDMVGTVTKIRIRATTITDWDRKELIVPNKEFVTGRLVNWTLSDQVLRVIIRVGVAYGSNTELAEKLLYDVARSHPLVLDDPAPIVLFKEFAESTLDFDLRVYISGIEHYLQVWHELNMAIDRTFRAEGITIAFPQRDTHLKTQEPLEVRILSKD